MNNDELKKKIAEIILQGVHAEPLDNSMAIEIADALIAAGIGDVKENENRARAAEFAAKTVTDKAIRKYKEMKHRAEVAERALYIAATQLKCRGGIGKGFCRVDECDYYNCNNNGGCVKAHLKQAEKELEEKGI